MQKTYLQALKPRPFPPAILASHYSYASCVKVPEVSHWVWLNETMLESRARLTGRTITLLGANRQQYLSNILITLCLVLTTLYLLIYH